MNKSELESECMQMVQVRENACDTIVRRIEQLRIGLTDDNFLMLHLNPMK